MRNNADTADIEIRIAQREDGWAVEKLFGALHAFNSQLDQRFALAEGWAAILRDHLEHSHTHQNAINLLAWQHETPVGLIMMDGHTDSPIYKHRHWAELVALYIDPAARNQGLSTKLLEAGLAWAQQHGYERVQLYVTASNQHAKDFYQRAGFQAVQEIWRLELSDVNEPDIYDEICETEYAQGVNLLSVHQHKLILEPTPEGD